MHSDHPSGFPLGSPKPMGQSTLIALGGQLALAKPIKPPVGDQRDVSECTDYLCELHINGRQDTDVSRKPFQRLCPDDPVMVEILLQCEKTCLKRKKPLMIQHAINGLVAKSLPNVMRRLYQDKSNLDFTPPQLVDRNEFSVKYSTGKDIGREFELMGQELYQAMNVFLLGCNDRGVAPVRWNWDYNMLKRLDLLDSTDLPLKLLAYCVCLNLSCSTKDFDCTQGTVNLKRAGCLKVRKLANADPAEIAKLIRVSGIQNERSKQLVEMAKTALEEHNGVVPADYDVLLKLSGYGRKTILLLDTEVFGFLNGLATDKHVSAMVQALPLVKINPGDPRFTVRHAESSLTAWVPERRWHTINRIFGSFAQLFTMEFSSIERVKQTSVCLDVMDGMLDYLHQPHHFELLWCAIYLVRVWHKHNET